MERNPNLAWKLAAFYFLLFAYLGVFLPWLPPLLARRGLDAAAIGLALATVQVSRALLPPLWGLLADRLSRKRSLLAIAAFAAGACLIALSIPGPNGLIFAWLFLHGFFLVPLFPLAETLTMGALGRRPQRYGRIRLWGSVGFLVTSFGLGLVVDLQGWSPALLPWLMGLPLVLAGVLALILPETPEAPAASPRPAKRSLPWRWLLPVLVAAGLGQGSHGPYYAFFTLQMEGRGVSASVIGALWAWGVVAEVVLMALSGLLIRRTSLAGVFRLALLLGGLRWALYALDPPLAVVAAGQTLHGASFALLHISTIRLVDRFTPPGRKAFGQTLVSACAYGLAIGLGTFLSGQFVSRVGFSGLYAGAAAASALALVVSAWLRREPRKR